MNHTLRTVTEEDLTLGLGRAAIRGRIRLTHFIVGFYIDVRAFLQVAEEIVRVLVEGNDVMPGSFGLRTSCQSDASVPQATFAHAWWTYCHRD